MIDLIQVILPYLKEKFETEDEDKNVVVSVLDLLCSLVKVGQCPRPTM